MTDCFTCVWLSGLKFILILPCFHQDNPSEKDINQGTVVAFDLESSVSDDDLRQIFGVYGEIKEVSLSLLNFCYFF